MTQLSFAAKETVRRHRGALALLAVLLLAGALRTPALGAWPAGLHPDEAAEGLSALRILGGARPLYLEENNGREPMFAYLAAISVAALGRTPGAIRIVGVAADLAAVAGVYLAIRALFNRRIGLAACLCYAVTVWPILAGRFGVRWSLLAPLLAFCLWQGVLAWRSGRTRHWLAAGALLGLAAYTYTAVRVFPLFLGLLGIYLALRRGRRRLWPGAALGLAACGAIVLPLAFYSLAHWDGVMSRSAQAAIFRPGMPAPEAARLAAGQAYQVMRMFVFSGDWNPRQNIWRAGTPETPRPVFDSAMAIVFLAGHWAALKRWRRPAVFACYAWLGVMLLPVVFSDEAPHFGRAVGALPVVFVWPALGLAALCDWLRPRAGAWPALLVPAFLLGQSTLATVRDLWVERYLGQPWLSSNYYGGPTTEVALEVNKFLGAGWTGANLAALPPTHPPQRQVMVEQSLAQSPAFEFLVDAGRPAVRIVAAGSLPRAEPDLETLFILPAEAGLEPAMAPPAGLVVQVCLGGFNWLPPDNQRGVPLFTLVAFVYPESRGPCA